MLAVTRRYAAIAPNASSRARRGRGAMTAQLLIANPASPLMILSAFPRFFLGEDRCPPVAMWEQSLVASRLLEYETWTRLNARKLSATHADAARSVLDRIAFVELTSVVFARALEPFPTPVRTLDALHLASCEFLRSQGIPLELATYDDRMREAARKLKIPVSVYS
jgi:predicted nucleic acid-binding protein